MRIAINGLAIGPQRTGIGRVTVQSLHALLARRPDDEFWLFLPEDAPEGLFPDTPNLTTVRTDVSLDKPVRSLLFEEFELPRRLKGARIDLYYAPSFLLPFFPGAEREIICVHDLAWRFFPKSKSFRFRSYMNARLPAALRRASQIVTVSAATADDVVTEYGEEFADRLRVVPNGVDLDVFRPDPTRPETEEPFLAVVGNQDPRKNIGTLLDALPAFRARMRPCRLVLVGPGARPLPAPPSVDFLGYLADDELVSLYQSALMVVQPSLYEGFGLPVLEAMACGAPVACADIPVFREVTGGAAKFFDPRDAGSIAQVMADLARDDDTRADLAERGYARAQEFSWERTGDKLDAVFTEALS
ncbi:MAG: glycosyltransferase family 1 protein [Planctomycetota bacterium]